VAEAWNLLQNGEFDGQKYSREKDRWTFAAAKPVVGRFDQEASQTRVIVAPKKTRDFAPLAQIPFGIRLRAGSRRAKSACSE